MRLGLAPVRDPRGRFASRIASVPRGTTPRPGILRGASGSRDAVVPRLRLLLQLRDLDVSIPRFTRGTTVDLHADESAVRYRWIVST